MTTHTLRARSGHVVGKRGGTTRQLILQELAAQLESKPLAEVSVVDVARGVQCSPATVYQYFPNLGAAAKALTRMLQSAKEPLPDGLVDQRARADALAAELAKIAEREARFPVVTICGSMRFRPDMDKVGQRLSRDGFIVLMPFVTVHPDEQLADPVKAELDLMHRAKIDMSGSIYVVNPGGYIGESTRGEIAYARATGKSISAMVTLDEELADHG